jgi:hypothetical protein
LKLLRHVAWSVEKRSAFRVLVGKPEGKRPSGRGRHRWGDNIEVDLKDIGWEFHKVQET